jgi:uncharacterized protein YecA (UPF0149 family)
MSDGELLAKLQQFGFDAQRQGLVDGFPNFVSAEAMSKAMIAGADTACPCGSGEKFKKCCVRKHR